MAPEKLNQYLALIAVERDSRPAEWALAYEIHRLRDENEQLREERDRAHLARIEAQNPGIDIDRVRRERAGL